MTPQRRPHWITIGWLLLLSLVGLALAAEDTAVHASSILRVGIQKEEASLATSLHHHVGRCDGSILSELLREELWTWAHAEIESFVHEFELGDLELDNIDAAPVEQLLLLSNKTASAAPASSARSSQFMRGPNNILNNGLPETEDASAAASSTVLQRNYCNPETSNGLCHMFRAPLNIPTPPQQRTRGGGKSSLLSKMATSMKKAFHQQLPGWMQDNTVLIGTSCARDAASLLVSVEIVGGPSSDAGR